VRFGRGGWGSIHNAGSFSNRSDTFNQNHAPEYHQFQQNRFNETSQLQSNRSYEANYLQGQRQATWNNYKGNWGGYMAASVSALASQLARRSPPTGRGRGDLSCGQPLLLCQRV
jgi:hypothetical protein